MRSLVGYGQCSCGWLDSVIDDGLEEVTRNLRSAHDSARTNCAEPVFLSVSECGSGGQEVFRGWVTKELKRAAA